MTKKTLIIPLLLLLAAALLSLSGCEQPSAPPDNNTEYGSLSGLVLDQETALPIAAAVVTALKNAVADTTDSQGAFLLDSLALGIDTIMVTAELYDTAYSAILVNEGSQQDTVYLPVEEPEQPVELNTQIIASFATPSPSPQGLAWDGAKLWLSDDTTDTLYVIDPANGAVDTSFAAPGPALKGLTFDGTNIWNLDSFLKRLYEINPVDGLVLNDYDLESIVGNSTQDSLYHGLTSDGVYLYTYFPAGWSSKIVKMDVINGSATPVAYSNGIPKDLAYDGTYIWASNDRRGLAVGIVNQYDPISKLQLDRFYAPGYYPTGITYDGSCFWIADNGSDSLYQIQLTTVGVEDNVYLPRSHVLYQNYPNPFNSETTIKYQIDKLSDVSLAIYDLNGAEVRQLIYQKQGPGEYEVSWDGRDAAGRDVPTGIYITRIVTSQGVRGIKLVMMK